MKNVRNKNREIIFCETLAKALELQNKVCIDFLQEEGLIFVLTEIYELNSYNPSILFADIKIDVFNDIPVAIISMNPDREDKI